MFGLKKPKGFQWFWVIYLIIFAPLNFANFASHIKGGDYGGAILPLLVLAFVIWWAWFMMRFDQRLEERYEKAKKEHEEFIKEMERIRDGRNKSRREKSRDDEQS